MEEVEETTKAAVENCHRVLSLLETKDQLQCINLKVETEEVVFKFRRVVSLLGSGLGRGRVRKSKMFNTSLPQRIFLDSPHSRTLLSPKPLQVLPTNCFENPIQEMDSKSRNSLQPSQKKFFGNPTLDMKSASKVPPNTSKPKPSQCHLFLGHQHHHQQQIQMMHFQQQQIEFQADKYSRSNSGICLTFDGSTQASTMSSTTTRSFISSLSIDGSGANLGDNSFYSIGMPQLSNQISKEPKRRCSGKVEGGSMKCGSNSNCHCSKRRSGFSSLVLSIGCVLISSCFNDLPLYLFIGSQGWEKPLRFLPSVTRLLIFLLMSFPGENTGRSRSRALLILGIQINFCYMNILIWLRFHPVSLNWSGILRCIRYFHGLRL